MISENSFIEVAASVTCGATFSSFEELQLALAKYSAEKYVDMHINRSRTLLAAKRSCPAKVEKVDPSLKYYYVDYRCIHGGDYRKTGTGRRQSTTFRKDCPFRIFVTVSNNGKSLKISEFIESHNHEVSENLYMQLPNQRRLYKNWKEEVASLLEFQAQKFSEFQPQEYSEFKKQKYSEFQPQKYSEFQSKKTVVTFISGNAGKIAEVQAILGRLVQVNCVKLDLPEYQGEADFITSAKCRRASEEVPGPVIVEDVSLCFNALNGLPGPYVKWFLDKLGPNGLVKLLAGWEDKSASAVCIFAFSESAESTPKLFHGVTKGTIVPSRGDSGFGFDSCFLPDGYNKTYAEMSNVVKNKISHRRKALDLLSSYLEQKANFEKESCERKKDNHSC